MGDFKAKIEGLKKLPLDKAVKRVATKAFEIPFQHVRKQLIKRWPIDIKDSYFNDFEPNFKFFFGTHDKDLIVKRLHELEATAEIINDAEKIHSHVFNLLGSGEIHLGRQLPWNKDFKTNFIWENKFYKDIKVIDLSNNADVKVPWELSRFQHLFTLGKAYWISGDEKYSIEFKDEIEDWITNNPIEMSVNWTCTMDVGIRAVNWIAAYPFFKDSRSIPRDFWKRFNKSLYLHGRFIMKNLENKGVHTGNHYLSNIVGLIWLGIYFGSFIVEDNKRNNNPTKWLEFGVRELEKEMFVQNNIDGTNYEASTSYHRLVTELFLLTTILCNNNNIYFKEKYMDQLENMCSFIMNITKPNGLSPIIGDADDGRLLILSNYSTWVRNDFRHLLGIAGEFFNRDDFHYYGKAYSEDALWIYKTYKKYDKNQASLKSISFKEGGYYILRNDRFYCFIRCGELSFHGEGVHSHNDQLSFELNIDGEDFFIDPGSYVYTADYKMRNLFRSTGVHNTVQIENLEQNDFDEDSLFYMKEQTDSKCIRFQENLFEGEHIGYLKKINTVHNRIVSFEKNGLDLTDTLSGNINRKAYGILHLAPDIICEIKNDKILLLKNKISVEIFGFSSVNILESYLSIAYGSKLRSNKLMFPFTKKLNLKIRLIQ